MLLSAGQGHTKAVRLLLVNGADINKKNVNGHTPLMAASIGGYSEIVRIFIDYRANINQKDSNGLSALDLAEDYGQVAVFEMLKKAGAASKFDQGSNSLISIENI